jgi:hypothetical protein
VGGQHEQLLGKAGAGAEQAVQRFPLAEFLNAAEGGEDALVGPAVLPVVLDDLQVGAGPGFLGAEEQGGLRK